METTIFVFVAITLVGGVAAQWVGWRFRVPPIIVLLLLGLAVGPGLGIISPSDQLGHALEVIVGLSVAVIVFEGGLKLNLSELKEQRAGVTRLILLGLPLNWLFATLAAHWIVGLPWSLSVVFGAILVVTGPTVILPLLRHVRLLRRPAALMKWEAVVNDPIGAMVTVLALEYLLVVLPGHTEGSDIAFPMGRLVLALAACAAMAVAAALLVRWLFHGDRAPELMRTPMLLAAALGLYTAGNVMQDEAGLFAATVFGLALANLNITGLRSLSRSKESLSTLLVSALFILLAADLRAEDFSGVPAVAAAVLVGVVLVAVRPLAMLLATAGSGLTWRERLLIGWIGPRGIVAAALAGIAGSRLEATGYEGAELLLPLVFSVIAATVVAHGLTLAPAARLLGLRTTVRPGILIAGANPFTVELARTLKAHDVPAVIADRSWTALRPAREYEIPGLAVEILSERVESALELGQVDYVLAATDDDAYNALVCARFAPELGRERVHQLAMRGHEPTEEAPPLDWRGKIVAATDLDHRAVNDLIADGWGFSVRPPAEKRAEISGRAEDMADTPLLILKADGRIIFNSPERKAHARLRAGDMMVFFEPPAGQKAAHPQEDRDIPVTGYPEIHGGQG